MNPALIARRPVALLLLTGTALAMAQTPKDTGVTRLDPIQVITTKPLRGGLLQSVARASILEGERLRRATRQNLGETLDGELGVHADTFGPGAGRPNIRGLERQRVKVMENGIDAMDLSAVSADHAVGIEASNASRIEILRGPETLAWGSSAVGGVVNVINDRIPVDVEAPVTGLANAEYASNADEQAYFADLGGRTGRFAWHLDAAHREANDLEIPGFANADIDSGQDNVEGVERGTVANSGFNTDSAAAGFAWSDDRLKVGMSVSHLDSLYGVPGQEHGEDEEEEEENVSIDLEQVRYDFLAKYLEPARGLKSIELRAGVNDYEHDELEGDEVGTEFENDEIEARLELVHETVAGLEGAFGAQLGDRDFSALGEEAFVPPNDTERLGAFWIGSKPLTDTLTLDLGVRYEDQDVASSTLSTGHDALSASIGAAWELAADRFLTANLQRSERNPTAEELLSDGVHAATQSFEVGDPGLDTETNISVDLGFRGVTDTFDWEANVFYNHYQDFIFLSPTGAAAEGFPVFRYAQRDAEFHGFEAALGARLLDSGGGSAYARLFTDYTRGKLDDGGDLPRIPPLRIGAEFEGGYRQWGFAARVVHHAEQDKTAPFETQTGSYTTLGFDIDYRIESVRLDWTVFLRGDNITDEKGRRHQSRLKDFVPIRGRALTFGVRGTW